MRKTKLNKLLKVTLASLMTVALFGCSTNKENNGGASEVTELTFWYSWQDKVAENNLDRKSVV